MYNAGHRPWRSCGLRWTAQQKRKAARRAAFPEEQGCRRRPCFLLERSGYAVSPYTVMLMSTTTSVCSATLTVESPTVLIGPEGMRTCDLLTL